MTEFEYDCLQEERRSGIIRKRLSCRRAVRLPSDNLEPRELEQKNGPCRVYRLGRPMTGTEFGAMPADVQRLYLQHLRHHGASASDVEQMLGLSRGQLDLYRVRFDRPDRQLWSRFLRPEEKEG